MLAHVLERQISYFGDEAGFEGLLKHLGDSPWAEILLVIISGFGETNPLTPFTLWKDVGGTDLNQDFKDFVCGLTNLDPAKRLTAHEALQHKWLKIA